MPFVIDDIALAATEAAVEAAVEAGAEAVEASAETAAETVSSGPEILGDGLSEEAISEKGIVEPTEKPNTLFDSDSDIIGDGLGENSFENNALEIYQPSESLPDRNPEIIGDGVGEKSLENSVAELSKPSESLPEGNPEINKDGIGESSLDNSVEGKMLPRSGGRWEGEVGNSRWMPDRELIPNNRNYSNPEGKAWGQILDEHGINGISFEHGEPDFAEVSKGTVEIDYFSDARYGVGANFDQADAKLAQQRGCTNEEVRQWRAEHNYTWHERSDCKTMDLVPREVHGNVAHSGGISVIRKAI